ncbi:hypothetical protein BGW38_008895 [Lunasporangiospora selenospora]|uniref:Pre-mRNA-processing factor 39 n=1 Tax=Lunasporangiospora selenospora TaxID=979761 RepID=A0A9P6KII6_9FUNG|nr:hypothetical protein BGW38_008895 [Lunasporangiospora selenospora]
MDPTVEATTAALASTSTSSPSSHDAVAAFETSTTALVEPMLTDDAQDNANGKVDDQSTADIPIAEPPTTTPSGAPMPTTADPTLIEAWDRYWAIVQATPTDFDAWEELLRLVDRQDGGFGPEAPPANISNVRVIYDAFLGRFPLCFGYWKKYSDLVFLSIGVDSAIEVFERGVKSIPNSVDLWVQYCSFVMEQKPNDRAATEQLFERGSKCVGMDFMPHVFWDKYIEFLEEKSETTKAVQLLEHIIKIPMHQYARYFEKYSQLVASRPLNELIPEERLAAYKNQLGAGQESKEGEEDAPQETSQTEEQLEAQIRQLIMESATQVYTNTAMETNKRWPFEAEIKRPYFHVKPMDMPQLSNWRRYLDFEETEGDVQRIRILYERCLVTCALYEEFWLRYGTWTRSQNNVDQLQDVYSRAVHFVPSTNPSTRLLLALVEEERGEFEDARQHYKTMLGFLPGHIETIVRFASFERRVSPKDLESAELVYASQLGLENVDELTQTAIVTLYAKFLWQIKKDAEGARAIFKTGEGKFASKFYFSNYVKFEKDQDGDDYEERVSNVYEQARLSSLPESVKNDYNQSYLDFVMEFGSSAARYNNLETELKAPSVYVAESRKRAATEQAEEERAKKQAKQDEAADQGAESTSPSTDSHAPAADHNGNAPAVSNTASISATPAAHWGAHSGAYGYPAAAYPYAAQTGASWGYPSAADPNA